MAPVRGAALVESPITRSLGVTVSWLIVPGLIVAQWLTVAFDAPARVAFNVLVVVGFAVLVALQLPRVV